MLHVTRGQILMGGGLAVLGLTLVAAQRVVPRVERTLRDQVTAALDHDGITWAAVEVDGRSIVLSGSPGDQESQRDAISAAEAVPGVARVRTRFGRLGAGTGLPALSMAETAAEPPQAPGEDSATGKETDSSSTPPEEVEARGDDPPPPTPDVRPSSRAPCSVRVPRAAQERVLIFATGSTTVEPADRPALDEIATALLGCREWTLTLVGYRGADEGREAWELADRRARAVARYLVGKGVDETRLAPISGTDTSDSAAFARVEIFANGGE